MGKGNKKFIDILYKYIDNLCKLFMVLQVLIVSRVVFGRFILNKTPAWGEELALLCMVWFSLLSASLAVKNNAHIRISVIDSFLSEKALKVMHSMYFIFMLVFSIFMLVEGTKLSLLTLRSIMPGTGISISWLYLSVPVSGLAMLLTLIGKGREIA